MENLDLVICPGVGWEPVRPTVKMDVREKAKMVLEHLRFDAALPSFTFKHVAEIELLAE